MKGWPWHWGVRLYGWPPAGRTTWEKGSSGRVPAWIRAQHLCFPSPPYLARRSACSCPPRSREASNQTGPPWPRRSFLFPALHSGQEGTSEHWFLSPLWALPAWRASMRGCWGSRTRTHPALCSSPPHVSPVIQCQGALSQSPLSLRIKNQSWVSLSHSSFLMKYQTVKTSCISASRVKSRKRLFLWIFSPGCLVYGFFEG